MLDYLVNYFFLLLILGLRKAGLSAAFINYHLKGHPLIHSIKVSEAPVLIIGSGNFTFI